MKVNVGKNYDYDEIRSVAKRKIDASAELARAKLTQTQPIQSVVYQMKVEEARSILKKEDASTPLIDAEVGITMPTREKIAQLVMMKYEQWKKDLGEVERLRISTKKQIDAAPNRKDIIDQIVSDTIFNV
jgi:hypothetical protein